MSYDRAFKQLSVQELPEGGIVVRFIRRRLLADEVVQQVRDELQALVAHERLMVIDMSNVDAISSHAIAALMRMHRVLKDSAGALTLCGLQPALADTFRFLRLDRWFDLYEDLESALERE